jgi:hypothetical protein
MTGNTFGQGRGIRQICEHATEPHPVFDRVEQIGPGETVVQSGLNFVAFIREHSEPAAARDGELPRRRCATLQK